MNLYEFGLKDLDLRNKLVLDCAIGAGESTYYWAREINRQGGTSRILGLDIHLTEEDQKVIGDNLRDYKRYVELKEMDISRLDGIEENSVDYVNCDDTLVFVNSEQGKLTSTIKEFYRVLKEGGVLVINSEIPMEYSDIPYEKNQFRRWNFAKAVFALNGEKWSDEPSYTEVKHIVENVGFVIVDEMKQRPFKQSSPEDCINEWEEIMNKKIRELIISNDLRKELLNEVIKIKEDVRVDGLACPGYFSIKCQKTSNHRVDLAI